MSGNHLAGEVAQVVELTLTGRRYCSRLPNKPGHIPFVLTEIVRYELSTQHQPILYFADNRTHVIFGRSYIYPILFI